MTQRLEIERRIRARPETIFAYFTDPERYLQWMGVDAQLDARPGGVYRVRVPQGFTALGEFQELDPPHRVVFTWGWEGHDTVPAGSTRVEVTLTRDGDETIVRLVHSGLPGAEELAQHRQGWDRYLDRLVVVGAGGHAGPDVADDPSATTPDG